MSLTVLEKQNPQELKQIIINIPKENASFLYFILESNEGVCFYSTLPYEVGDKYRTIEINYTIGFQIEVQHLLTTLKEKLDFEANI